VRGTSSPTTGAPGISPATSRPPEVWASASSSASSSCCTRGPPCCAAARHLAPPARPPSRQPAAGRTGRRPRPAGAGARPLSVRFAWSLGRLALRLLPEYLLLVVALGAARAWLFPLGLDHGSTVLAVAGTLLPIPTGGEVAVVAALLASGAGAATAAALLVTLPAVSLPSLLMVRRVFPHRVLAGTFAAVVGTGLLTAAVAWGVGL
jgi:hypothetical protein